MIRPESWEKFRPALKTIRMSIVIPRYTKKLAEISARSVKKWIYTCMFPMERMEKLASISANFQKTSKVSISVTLCKALKELAEISASLGLSGEGDHVF